MLSKLKNVLQVAICDDEHSVLSELCVRIEAAFAKRDIDVRVYPFTSVAAVIEQMQNNPFDVLFLDIEMPEMDGVDLGIQLRLLSHEACIVFISNRDDRVFETFQVLPLRFIRKIHFNEEIDDAIRAIEDWRNKHQDELLSVSSSGIREIILVNDIIYVECLDKVQNIVTVNRTIPVRYTMGFLEENLPDFLKPHKGYLVNYRFIDYIKTETIVLKNGVTLPVSRHRITELKQAYLKLFSQSLPFSARSIHMTENSSSARTKPQ